MAKSLIPNRSSGIPNRYPSSRIPIPNPEILIRNPNRIRSGGDEGFGPGLGMGIGDSG